MEFRIVKEDRIFYTSDIRLRVQNIDQNCEYGAAFNIGSYGNRAEDLLEFRFLSTSELDNLITELQTARQNLQLISGNEIEQSIEKVNSEIGSI